jgi:ATP-dependent exoDNAse (exonuclease V) beta subunit
MRSSGAAASSGCSRRRDRAAADAGQTRLRASDHRQARNHLVNIVAELARHRVIQATDIDPLAGRPIVLDLLALTRAIAHAAPPRLAAVLRAPWGGLTLAELHALCGDDRDAALRTCWDPARRERCGPAARVRLRRCGRCSRAASELRRFGLRDAVERAWLAGRAGDAQSSAALDEAQAYLDRLAELSHGPRPAQSTSRLSPRRSRSSMRRPAAAGQRVELLTIHKAKGLRTTPSSYPGLDRPPRGDRRRLLQDHSCRGRGPRSGDRPARRHR